MRFFEIHPTKPLTPQQSRIRALQQRDRPLYSVHIPKVTTICPFDLQE
jgi:hypothetical protein